VEYLNYLDSVVTNVARYTWEIKTKTALAKSAHNNETVQQQNGLTFKEGPSKVVH
jgi:hypothetical protein